jgi:tRNA threonylcarbamoyladenosine biosynthesis protein TsaB
MWTLALDSSSDTGSAAILQDRTTVMEGSFRTDARHAATLLEFIRTLMAHAGKKIQDMDLIVLTEGPGSFTGLRIGASTVKGLALPNRTPVVLIPTLEALACNAVPSPWLICPMLDARRKEVYTALFETGADGMPERKAVERVTDAGLFIRGLSGEVLFIGDGARKYAGLIAESCPGRARFAPDHHHVIRASAVGYLGVARFLRGEKADLLTFTPRYLRLSQAEVQSKS